MNRFFAFFKLSFPVLAVLSACDNEHNVRPRFEDYFIKFYGGNGNQQGVDLAVLGDGFLLLGKTSSPGFGSQAMLVRTDVLGNEVWRSEFGGPQDEDPVGLVIGDDNAYVIAATITLDEDDSDIALFKVLDTGNSGELIDEGQYGNIGTREIANSIITTLDGGFVVTGSTDSVILKTQNQEADFWDVYSIRTDAALNLFERPNWFDTYGFEGQDFGVKVIQKSDETFLFFGTTNRPSVNVQQMGFNMFLFPAGRDGLVSSDSEFQSFGTIGNEQGADINQTSDGGYIMSGSSVADNQGTSDIFIARVRSNNSFIRANGINSARNVAASAIIEAQGGGFLVLGQETSNSDNIYLSRINTQGVIEWERSFGGGDGDNPGKLVQMEDGSIVFIGTVELENQTKIGLFKTNINGELSP